MLFDQKPKEFMVKLDAKSGPIPGSTKISKLEQYNIVDGHAKSFLYNVGKK